MKNLASFAIFWMVLVLAGNSLGFAQNTADNRCPDLQVVMQHKTLAVKLKLKIAPNLIDTGNNMKRCPSRGEMIEALEEKFPEYAVDEYGELFEQRR